MRAWSEATARCPSIAKIVNACGISGPEAAGRDRRLINDANEVERGDTDQRAITYRWAVRYLLVRRGVDTGPRRQLLPGA